MNSSNVIFLLVGLEFIVGMLWVLALKRAYSSIMTSAFFGAERPLALMEYWRYLASSTLMMVTVAFIVIIVSYYDLHHPIYRYPAAVVRLILVNLAGGLTLGAGSWLLFKIQMKRLAKFHHPNMATWKGLGFWGPKMRKMTPEERIEFLRRMNLSDYLECLRLSFALCALLTLTLLWGAMVLKAPMAGFNPALASFFRHLALVEILLVGVCFILATLTWLIRRFLVWLGWSRTYL